MKRPFSAFAGRTASLMTSCPCRTTIARLSLGLAFIGMLALTTPARGADDDGVPGAPMLLPEDTLAYIRIADMQELREGAAETSLGRMFADPKMKPFASDVYQTVQELFEQVSATIGVELNELLAIPQGQVAIAMVPRLLAEPDEEQEEREDDDDSEEAIKRRLDRKRRQQYGFAGVLVVEAKDNVETIRTLIEKADAMMKSNRLIKRTSKIDGTELVRWLPPRQGNPPVEYFFRDGAFAIGIGHDTAGGVLKRWAKEDTDPTFANSNDFTSVMSRSVGAEETLPQITFYVDPYKIVERAIKGGGGGAALAWPLIESLGIGKIRGIGGSTFRGGEFFDDISHAHILIDPPRDGFFGVLRPGDGTTVPPNWVPADVSSYTTIHWRFDKSVENLFKVVDKFSGEGAFERFVEDPAKKRTGVSVQEELLPLLTGRYVGLRWLQPPMALNSQTSTIALEVTDAEAAKELFDKFRDRVPQAFKPEVIGGTMTYAAGRGPQRVPEGFRVPNPTVFQIGNWFVFTDSHQMVKRIVQANAGNLPRLNAEADYDLVSNELGGKLDGESPFAVSYVRSSDVFRQFYELAQEPNSKQQLRKLGESNPVAAKFAELLERQQLPPFSVFEKYFGSGGIFAYDEPNGIHIGSFNLKPIE